MSRTLRHKQPTSLTERDFGHMIGLQFVIWNSRTQDVAFQGTVLDLIKTSKYTYIEAHPADPSYRKREELGSDDPRHDEHFLVSGEHGDAVWMDLAIALGYDEGFQHFSGHQVAVNYQ